MLLNTATLSYQEPAVWHKLSPPIQTRWYDDVSPSNAHPEYPRPQMLRDDWLNLNGIWQFMPALEGESPPFGRVLPEQILVPYPIESALSGLMRHESRMWYRREFEVPSAWTGKRLLLHFDAVDWRTTVYVNGQKIGTHSGGYDRFTFDITDSIRAQNPQELIVYVEDPTDQGGQPRGKQVLEPGGIWYTPTSGIWQTVWLEPVAPVYIGSLQMTPDIDSNVLRLKINTGGDTQNGQHYTVEATASENGNPVGRARGAANTEFEILIPNPNLWSPDHPFLYDLQVRLLDTDRTVDEISSYFGMRKISLGNMGDIPHILLNNHFIFQIGPLDQGFWPEGIYTAPTDEAMKADLEFARQIGWNMIRKHIKVEPERWYYWADKLGLLVWQDMPSPDANNRLALPESDFEAELRAMIEGRRNHPSIVLWVVFNEGWGQEQFGAAGTERFTQRVRELDPSRLVTNASGWTDYKVGDIFDVHNYVGPSPILPEKERATVQGEFGGLGLHVPGHEWSSESFAYEWQDNSAILTARYTGLIDQARLQMLDFGLSAAVYTEIVDVEEELNGFITYDREVIKVDVEAVYAANQKLIDQSTLIQ